MATEVRTKRTTWIIAGAVFAVAALVLAGIYVYQEMTNRAAALERLSEATELVRRADAVVIDVDEVVRGAITPELGVEASEAASAAPGAISDLERAQELIGQALPDLPEERAAEARALADSASARIRMLDAAAGILPVNVLAAEALKYARAGWDHLLEGEKLADRAIEEYNKLTRASVSESQRLNTQASERFNLALKEFQAGASAFPDAGIAGFVKYTESKIALIGISAQADAAFLAGRTREANELSVRFNATEQEVMKQLEALPETPEIAIAGAYERLAGPATTTYFEAREEATRADEALNEIVQ